MNKHSICISRQEMELSIKAYFGVDPEHYYVNLVWIAYSAMLRNEHCFQSLSAEKRASGKTLTQAIIAGLARNHFNKEVVYACNLQGQYRHFCRYIESFGIDVKAVHGGTVTLLSHSNPVPGAIILGDELLYEQVLKLPENNKDRSVKSQLILFEKRNTQTTVE